MKCTAVTNKMLECHSSSSKTHLKNLSKSVEDGLFQLIAKNMPQQSHKWTVREQIHSACTLFISASQWTT